MVPATLMLERRSVWVFVAPIPTEITAPCTAPDWMVKAGLFGFEAAVTYWVTLTYDVTPTSDVPIEIPLVTVTPSKPKVIAAPPAPTVATHTTEYAFVDEVRNEKTIPCWVAVNCATCTSSVPSTDELFVP